MKITKENKEVIIYIVCFLLVCFSYLILFMTAYNLYTKLVLSKIEGNCRMCGMLEIGLLWLFSWLIKIVIPIKGSLWVIKKSDNKKLQSIYNNFKVPAMILFFVVCFDVLIKMYIFKDYYLGQYLWTSAITPIFLIIYIIAVVNTVRIRMAKEKNL